MQKTVSLTRPKLGPMIRKRRKQLDLTLKDLSERSGVSLGYLSQVERDMAIPSLGTLAQIAQALEAGIQYFVATPEPGDVLTRARERRRFSVESSSVVYEQISADLPGSDLSSYILHIPPGYASEEACHDGEEIIFVLEGTVVQTLDGTPFHLNKGDSLHYNGSVPHSFSNPSDETVKLLWTGALSVLSKKGMIAPPVLHPATNSD